MWYNTNKCCAQTTSKLLIIVTILNVQIINVVPTNTDICTHVYLCISQYKYPRCCILNTLHELTHKSASWWLTQKLCKNCFLFQKECSQPYDFCREANIVGQTLCVCIAHVRAIIFCTCNQIMFIVNNIKKVFN